MSKNNISGDLLLTGIVIAIIIVFFVFAAKAVALVINTVEYNKEIQNEHNNCIKFEHSSDCRQFISAVPQSEVRH